MNSLISRLFFGAAAGLTAWAIMEPFAPKDALVSEGWEHWEQMFFLVYSGAVGLVIGGYDGFVRGGRVHPLRGTVLGLGFGIVAGMLGYQIGGTLSDKIFGTGVFSLGTNIAVAIMARTFVFACYGLCLGIGIGGSSLTGKRIVQGALGGLIGGAIGGACFDIVGGIVGAAVLSMQGQHQGEVGGPSRAIAFTLTAASIALFIGLVERYTRSAWLRLNLGRNEGKEWSIDAGQTFIGRDERSSVPLMGDPNVAPIHASITRQGNQYIISDAGSPIGTYVNGQRIQQAVLVPGSMIQIAGFALQFLIKGTPAPQLPPEAYRGQPYPAGVAPMGYQPAQPIQTAAYQPPSNPTIAFASPAPAATMGFAVVALDGPMQGQRFPVVAPIEIGREAAGIRLPDTNASRRHATFSPSFSGVTVTDMGSTNGTFVNGQRISTQEARLGDVIRVGNSSFRVDGG